MKFQLLAKKRIFLFLFIIGCSDSGYLREDISKISKSPSDAFYFSDIFLNASEINIEEQIQKLRDEYIWKSETDVFRNSFLCTYQHRDGGASNGGKVICEYLGNWYGQDIVARYYRTGGSGSFSDIVFCSIDSRKIKVHKIILLGDRAMDGLLSHPFFDGDGKIYFHMFLSNATLLEEAGVDEEAVFGDDGFTCAACYGIVGNCVYDIEKEEMKILSLNAFSDENKNQKIRTLISSRMNNGIAIFNEKETQEFLKKLRKSYALK
ncbi:MAG: hypothetical protein LBJ71_01560 [Holosporaceae bacterium]|jgi:hypothetical protein|nr:hypothetical protein [Holosporaceae bacterium]